MAAGTEQEAITIAEYVSGLCVGYTDVSLPGWEPQWQRPVLSIERAIEMGSVFPDYPESANFNSHIWRITRPGSDLGLGPPT